MVKKYLSEEKHLLEELSLMADAQRASELEASLLAQGVTADELTGLLLNCDDQGNPEVVKIFEQIPGPKGYIFMHKAQQYNISMDSMAGYLSTAKSQGLEDSAAFQLLELSNKYNIVLKEALIIYKIFGKNTKAFLNRELPITPGDMDLKHAHFNESDGLWYLVPTELMNIPTIAFHVVDNLRIGYEAPEEDVVSYDAMDDPKDQNLLFGNYRQDPTDSSHFDEHQISQ